MLVVILVPVFLHLNQICYGKSIEDTNDPVVTGNPEEEEVLELATEPTEQNATTGLLNPALEPLDPSETTVRLDIEKQQKFYNVRADIGDHWPLGVIPYYFDPESYDNLVATRFRDALNSVESSSCVKFKQILQKPGDGRITWLHVTNPTRQRACVHEPAVDASTGEIQVLLGLDCLKRRDILHTLLHTIGLTDEVGHPQRDLYIRVLWENIQHEYRQLFRVQLNGDAITEYDPASIMHFHDRAYTLNGQATIAPLMSGLFINPSNDLSPLDKMKLRLLFSRECNRRKVGNLLDTCKNVLHKEYYEEGKEDRNQNKKDKENRPADEQDTAHVTCWPGTLGCLPIQELLDRNETLVPDEFSAGEYGSDQFADISADENGVTVVNKSKYVDHYTPSADVVEIID